MSGAVAVFASMPWWNQIAVVISAVLVASGLLSFLFLAWDMAAEWARASRDAQIGTHDAATPDRRRRVRAMQTRGSL